MTIMEMADAYAVAASMTLVEPGLKRLRDNDATRAALEAAVKELERPKGNYRWIPTSERMPEPQVNVFVRQINGKVGVCAWWGDDFEFKVTHWMPLPAVPVDAAIDAERSDK